MVERTPENKAKAISFAAYAALVDLFPSRQGDFALQSYIRPFSPGPI